MSFVDVIAYYSVIYINNENDYLAIKEQEAKTKQG